MYRVRCLCRHLIDVYITPMLDSKTPDFGPLTAAILRVAVFYALGVVSALVYNQIMVVVSQGTLRQLRDTLFDHMESLPISYFDTHSHGDIMSIYTNDIDTLRQMISQSIPQFINSGITIVSVCGLHVYLKRSADISDACDGRHYAGCHQETGGLKRQVFPGSSRETSVTVNGYIEEMMEGQKVVKVFCHEEESIGAVLNELNDQLFDSANNANRFANILMPVNAQIGKYQLCAHAPLSAVSWLSNGFGGLTLGELASFLTFNKSFNHADQPDQPAAKQRCHGTGRSRSYLSASWMKSRK